MASYQLQSKLAQAIKQCLLLYSPDCGSDIEIFTELTEETRSLPNTSISVGEASELVRYTGNWRFQNVTIIIRCDASLGGLATPTEAREAMEARYTPTIDALSRSDTATFPSFMANELTAAGRSIGGDLLDFTVIHWEAANLPEIKANAEGTFYETALQFDCVACNSALS